MQVTMSLDPIVGNNHEEFHESYSSSVRRTRLSRNTRKDVTVRRDGNDVISLCVGY